MKKISLSLIIFIYLTTSSFIGAQTTWNTFNTDFGYIQLGPANANFAHIYTDRTKFLFNKELYVTGGGINSYSTSDLLLRTNGNTRLTIKNTNGNIGIGVTNPLEKLHINGNLLIQNDNTLRFGTENNNSGHLIIFNSASSYNSFADIKGNLYFRTEANQATMAIQKDATVTIGVWPKYDNTITNTDGHKLMVNGGILCEKIKIISDVPNSDHVFEKEYKLMNLSELKGYINENKHLPEIPSAEDFKQNGYSVGIMDDLLLRKIEELTLYTIQLKEEIEELKVKCIELKQLEPNIILNK